MHIQRIQCKETQKGRTTTSIVVHSHRSLYSCSTLRILRLDTITKLDTGPHRFYGTQLSSAQGEWRWSGMAWAWG